MHRLLRASADTHLPLLQIRVEPSEAEAMEPAEHEPPIALTVVDRTTPLPVIVVPDTAPVDTLPDLICPEKSVVVPEIAPVLVRLPTFA